MAEDDADQYVYVCTYMYTYAHTYVCYMYLYMLEAGGLLGFIAEACSTLLGTCVVPLLNQRSSGGVGCPDRNANDVVRARCQVPDLRQTVRRHVHGHVDIGLHEGRV